MIKSLRYGSSDSDEQAKIRRRKSFDISDFQQKLEILHSMCINSFSAQRFEVRYGATHAVQNGEI